MIFDINYYFITFNFYLHSINKFNPLKTEIIIYDKTTIRTLLINLCMEKIHTVYSILI